MGWRWSQNVVLRKKYIYGEFSINGSLKWVTRTVTLRQGIEEKDSIMVLGGVVKEVSKRGL